jgi:hypothetical protein
MLKKPSMYQRDTSYVKIRHFLRQSLLLCYYKTELVGLPEFWWTNLEFSSVDIFPPLVSMVIYYPGEEQ